MHMHTLKIAVLDPSTVPGGYSFERFRDELGARLHLLPPFRKRLIEVPLGVHDPMWINDPDFDIDRHIRRRTAAAPGGRREVDGTIAEIASTPLPRGPPAALGDHGDRRSRRRPARLRDQDRPCRGRRCGGGRTPGQRHRASTLTHLPTRTTLIDLTDTEPLPGRLACSGSGSSNESVRSSRFLPSSSAPFATW